MAHFRLMTGWSGVRDGSRSGARDGSRSGSRSGARDGFRAVTVGPLLDLLRAAP